MNRVLKQVDGGRLRVMAGVARNEKIGEALANDFAQAFELKVERYRHAENEISFSLSHTLTIRVSHCSVTAEISVCPESIGAMDFINYGYNTLSQKCARGIEAATRIAPDSNPSRAVRQQEIADLRECATNFGATLDYKSSADFISGSRGNLIFRFDFAGSDETNEKQDAQNISALIQFLEFKKVCLRAETVELDQTKQAIAEHTAEVERKILERAAKRDASKAKRAVKKAERLAKKAKALQDKVVSSAAA